MIISLENEIKLKKILKSKNKEQGVAELSREIEEKENNMLKYISVYYMNIIDKCNNLLEVKDRIPHILENNESVVASFKDLSIQFYEIKKEIHVHKELDGRIKVVLTELGKFLEFFRHAKMNYERDSLYFYRITTNLARLKSLKKEFLNYSFYDDLNEIYVKFKNNVKRETEELYKKWKTTIINQSEAYGKTILKMFELNCQHSNSESSQRLIFPEIDEMRNKLITKELLIVIWTYNKSGKLDDFIDRLNVERLTIIENYSDKDRALLSYATEFLLSFFLIKLNKGVNPHYDDLIDGLNKYFFESKVVLDLHNTKDVIVPFKNMLNYIKVEESILDQAIGKVTMDYFASHGISNLDLTEVSTEEFREAIKKFIDDSYDFINKIKNNEINEILAKKVDSYLENYLEVSDDSVEEMNKVVTEILEYCRQRGIYYLGQDFRSEVIIGEKFKVYKEEKVKEIDLVVNELFSEKDKDFNINIQRLFKENRIIENEMYEIIKVKFKEDIRKEENDKSKRICLSRVSCFLNFLKTFNEKLYKDFKDVESSELN